MHGRPLLLLGLALGAAGHGLAADATADFLRAVQGAPALEAAARRASAARERIDAAGRLPDPEIEAGAARMTGPMNERGTTWEMNVRQPLPKRGERAADRERASVAVALADADRALMAGELAADTAAALAEAEGAEARARLLETHAGRLDAVLRTLEIRLAAGGSSRLAERLTVQTRLSSLRLQIEEEQRTAGDALAVVRGRLGLEAAAPLPAFAAPAPADIKADESAALRVAAARGDEAAAMGKMARAAGQPATSVGLRFENERRTMGDETSVGLTFSTEIPWRAPRYARAEIRAAAIDRTAAQSDAASASFRVSAALSRVERAARLAETARRTSAETQQRLQAEYDAVLRTAAAGPMGESAVLQTVALLEKVTDTELQVLRADTAVRTARAELWRYAPVSQLTPP